LIEQDKREKEKHGSNLSTRFYTEYSM